jgi:hypothetical protein
MASLCEAHRAGVSELSQSHTLDLTGELDCYRPRNERISMVLLGIHRGCIVLNIT